VLFLDIAMEAGMSRKQLITRYDEHLGFPTPAMVAKMKESVDRANKIASFDDWYKVGVTPMFD